VDVHTKTPVPTRHSAQNTSNTTITTAARSQSANSFPGPFMLFRVGTDRNDQVVPTKPSLAHRTASRPRAASPQPRGTCARGHPLALLAGDRPQFIARTPVHSNSCMVPFNQVLNLSPGVIRNASAYFFPVMVVCPLLVYSDMRHPHRPYFQEFPYILMSLHFISLGKGLLR